MKMREIKGEKLGGSPSCIEGPAKSDIRYPSFYIGIQHLPEAKDWKIGEEYEITLRIKQTGLNIHRNESKKEDYGSADFEILAIGVGGPAKKEQKSYSRLKK